MATVAIGELRELATDCGSMATAQAAMLRAAGALEALQDVCANQSKQIAELKADIGRRITKDAAAAPAIMEAANLLHEEGYHDEAGELEALL